MADAAEVRVFAEHSHRSVRVYSAQGRRVSERCSAGACIDLHTDGAVLHQHADRSDLLDDPLFHLAGDVRSACRDVQGRPLPVFPADEDALLSLQADRTDATLTWSCLNQQLAAGGSDWVVEDARCAGTLEISWAFDKERASVSEVIGWSLSDPSAVRLSRLEEALEQLVAVCRLPRLDTVPLGHDVVLLPGRADAFFHELVGHPMEADVVLSGTSYLAQQAGRSIAPDWLTIGDGALSARWGYTARFDDEGTPSTPATMLDRGRVHEPLTDLATARVLRCRLTGHGRRLDFRHPVIPRMTHTYASVAPTAPPEPGDGDWIAVRGLQLQSMNVLTGDFVFAVANALLYRDGAPVRRLPPLLVRGNGLQVLSGLRPISPDSAEYFRASRGCGKLGQFPLIVSFANAGMRLPAGVLTVSERTDG